MRTVDVHAHVLLPEIERAVAGRPGHAEHRALDARRNGAASLEVSGRMIGERMTRLTQVAARLADMDSAGVDVQIVSPSPSRYHYWADRDLARTVWRLAGEGVTAHCAQAPDRLYGLGLVPLQHPDLAVEALDHAMALGLKGVEISSHAPGRELPDPELEPFWRRAASHGAVVFLHPFGCTLDERLDRFYLSNIVGQPVENAVALSHLIFSRMLDRHPRLKVLAAHGGGYLPACIGRADHGWRVRPEAHGCAALDFELEVAAVIGREGRDLTPEQARDHVFGYTIFNDWPARDLQAREMRVGLGPCKGKDSATTLGPWLVTADELEPYRDADGFLRLALTAEVNGREVGRDLLSNMGWTFEEMVAYASRGARVRPGDVLGSGTCGNGGCLAELWGLRGGQDPPLEPGDVVTLTVEGIGSVSNTVVPGTGPLPVPRARTRPGEHAG